MQPEWFSTQIKWVDSDFKWLLARTVYLPSPKKHSPMQSNNVNNNHWKSSTFVFTVYSEYKICPIAFYSKAKLPFKTFNWKLYFYSSTLNIIEQKIYIICIEFPENAFTVTENTAENKRMHLRTGVEFVGRSLLCGLSQHTANSATKRRHYSVFLLEYLNCIKRWLRCLFKWRAGCANFTSILSRLNFLFNIWVFSSCSSAHRFMALMNSRHLQLEIWIEKRLENGDSGSTERERERERVRERNLYNFQIRRSVAQYSACSGEQYFAFAHKSLLINLRHMQTSEQVAEVVSLLTWRCLTLYFCCCCCCWSLHACCRPQRRKSSKCILILYLQIAYRYMHWGIAPCFSMYEILYSLRLFCPRIKTSFQYFIFAGILKIYDQNMQCVTDARCCLHKCFLMPG